MNREVHVRFWERAEVRFLRATRQLLTHAPQQTTCTVATIYSITTLPIENQSFVSNGEGVFIPAFSFPGFDSIPGVILAKH